MKILLSILLSSLGCFVCRPTAKTATALLKKPVTGYMVIYTPGPAWMAELPAEQQPGLQSHINYLDSIAVHGSKAIGGPFADGKSGATLWLGKTKQQVQQIVERDPSVKAGVQQAEIKAWTIGLSNIKGAMTEK